MFYLTVTELMLVILLIILIGFLFSNINLNKDIEAFNNKSNRRIERYSGAAIFDNNYVTIYDSLFYNKSKNDFEIFYILKNTDSQKNNRYLLDIGSGTGHHVHLFNKKSNFTAIGLDKSQSMIEYSKKKFPDNEYKLGNVLNSIEFTNGTFTHITCLYYTIYYIKNKRQFFANCFNWLIPNGILIIHLVNKHKFDPVLPNSIIMPDKSTSNSERTISSKQKIKDIKYRSKFILDDTERSNSDDDFNCVFRETIKFNEKYTRVNEHKLYMESQNNILSLAKDEGFILKNMIEMSDINYDYNYLYYLEKP